MLVGTRRASLLVAGVVLAVGAAMPGVAAAPAVSSAVPGWRLVKTFGCNGGVVIVTATGARGAWATGFTACASYWPLIARWNGRSWQQLRAPLRFAPYGVGPAASLSSTYAWTFPAGRFALLWNNGRWRWYRLSHHNLFADSAVAFSRSDAWSFEWGPTARYAFHFDGHAWRRMTMPVSPREAAAPGPHNIWAVGPLPSGPNYGLAHWTGRHWRPIPFPDLNLPAGHFIDQAWVVSDGSAGAWVTADIGAPDFRFPAGVVLLRWTGRTWNQVIVPRQVDTLGPLAHDGHGGLWIASGLSQSGRHAMLHYSAAGTWSKAILPANVDTVYSMRLIPGTSSLWAGTQVLLHSHVIAAIFKYGR